MDRINFQIEVDVRKHTRWAEFLEWVAVNPTAPIVKGYSNVALKREFEKWLEAKKNEQVSK